MHFKLSIKLYIPIKYMDVLSLEDIDKIEININLPDESSIQKKFSSLDIPINKIKTKSFPIINIRYVDIANSLLADIPLISMRGEHTIMDVNYNRISFMISMKSTIIHISKPKKNKSISENEFQTVVADINYITGLVIGSLNLINKKIKREIKISIKMDGLFKNSFEDKIDKTFVDSLAITEVDKIDFARYENKGKDSKMKIEYSFRKGKTDRIDIKEIVDGNFSPIDIKDVVNTRLQNLNNLLDRW